MLLILVIRNKMDNKRSWWKCRLDSHEAQVEAVRWNFMSASGQTITSCLEIERMGLDDDWNYHRITNNIRFSILIETNIDRCSSASLLILWLQVLYRPGGYWPMIQQIAESPTEITRSSWEDQWGASQRDSWLQRDSCHIASSLGVVVNRSWQNSHMMSTWMMTVQYSPL